VGLILTLTGAAGVVVSAMVIGWSLSSESSHLTLNRQFMDLHRGFRTIPRDIERPTQRVLSSATTRPPRESPHARGTSNRRTVSVAADNSREFAV
jgi:hypothetical protein